MLKAITIGIIEALLLNGAFMSTGVVRGLCIGLFVVILPIYVRVLSDEEIV